LALLATHLYLDRDHPQWMHAVRLLLDQLRTAAQESAANMIVLRDFDPADTELEQFMLSEGYVKKKLPDNHVVRLDQPWTSLADFEQRVLERAYRPNFRLDVRRYLDNYDVVVDEPLDAAELTHCVRLFRNVAARSFEIATFQLSDEFFARCTADPYIDTIRIVPRTGARRLESGRPAPVAFLISHRGRTVHSPLIAGIDYDYVYGEHGTAYGSAYKQALFYCVQRAAAAGVPTVQLGLTAKTPKRTVGGVGQPIQAYVRVDNHDPLIEMTTVF
jgi:hypothetical protein